MDKSKEDNQVGALVPTPAARPICCTEKPYCSSAKKACEVDQYGAPPMNGSKNGQVGLPATHVAVPMRAPGTTPTTVPAGVPTAATTVKGPAAPMTGPMGALASAVKKGRPTRG
jgi:hypothetical protein